MSRNTSLLRKALIPVALASMLALSACGSSGSEDTKGGGGASITVVQGAEPECLDPYVSNLTHTFNVARHLYDTLAMVDRDLKIIPQLATEWNNVDPTTWDVTIRSGATFTNGEPVTANDVAASIKYGAQSNSQSFFSPWKNAEAQDDQTVRISTNGPNPSFESVLTRVFVMPASVLDSDPDQLCTEPVGSGPYEFKEWRKGQDITMVARPDHYLNPQIDEIIIKAVPEGSTRVNMLLSGDADLIANVPTDSLDQIESNDGTKLLSEPGIRRVVNVIDTREAPFDDVRVRQAMAHAVDMNAIVDTVLGGHGSVAVAGRPSLSPYADKDLQPYSYDPAKAKALLAEAGYPDGFTFDYHYPTGRWLKDSEVAQAIAGYLAEVGIRAELKTTQYETFFGDWSSGKYSGMSMIGVIDFDGSPASTSNLFLASDGPWSFSWSDPKFDELLQAASVEIDEDKAIPLFQEMEGIIHDQAIWCCGYDQDELFAAKEDLNYQVHPAERIVLWDASWK